MCFSQSKGSGSRAACNLALHLAHLKTSLQTEQLDISELILDVQLAGLLSQGLLQGLLHSMVRY
jgi:hypothetical protein